MEASVEGTSIGNSIGAAWTASYSARSTSIKKMDLSLTFTSSTRRRNQLARSPGLLGLAFWCTCVVLSWCGPFAHAQSCESATLLDELSSPNYGTKADAAYQLGRLCQVCDSVGDGEWKGLLARLEGALENELEQDRPGQSGSVLEETISALGECSYRSQVVSPVLLQLLRSPVVDEGLRRQVRSSISTALIRLQGGSESVSQIMAAFADRQNLLFEIPSIFLASVGQVLAREQRNKASERTEAGGLIAELVTKAEPEGASRERLSGIFREQLATALSHDLATGAGAYQVIDLLFAPARPAAELENVGENEIDSVFQPNRLTDVGRLLISKSRSSRIDFLTSLTEALGKRSSKEIDGSDPGNSVEENGLLHIQAHVLYALLAAFPASNTATLEERKAIESALVALVLYSKHDEDPNLLPSTKQLIGDAREETRHRIVLQSTQRALSAQLYEFVGEMLKPFTGPEPSSRDHDSVALSVIEGIAERLGSAGGESLLRKVVLAEIDQLAKRRKTGASEDAPELTHQHYALLEALIQTLESASIDAKSASIDVLRELYSRWEGEHPNFQSGIDRYFFEGFILALGDQPNLALRKRALVKLGPMIRQRLSSSKELTESKRWLLTDSLIDLWKAISAAATLPNTAGAADLMGAEGEIKIWLETLYPKRRSGEAGLPRAQAAPFDASVARLSP